MKSPSEKYEITGAAGNASRRKFSRVFFAREKDGNRRVVIKSLAKTHGNTHIQQRLRSEAGFSFRFPGLPEVLDFFETENEIMLVLAFREGVTLAEFGGLLKQKQKPAFVLNLLEKLRPIFAELREQDVLHLDIKPGNIIINGSATDFSVSLIDFGMAKKLSDTAGRTTLFPLGYAAPELILNRLQLADHRTDLFALGVTLWQLFTGKIPLLHANPSITTNLQITYPLPEHDSIPPRYLELLKKAAHKYTFSKPPNHYSPEETDRLLQSGMDGRYTCIEEMISDWKSAMEKKKSWFRF